MIDTTELKLMALRAQAPDASAYSITSLGRCAPDVLGLIAERDRLNAEIKALRKALIDVREAVQREYWDEYAGLDETRDILDAVIVEDSQS